MTRDEVSGFLREGHVVPAHPLALTAARKLDERRQRALTRYYCASGAGGVAVGVHTTQFEIHDPARGLLRPVIELASETADEYVAASGRPVLKIAGICGATAQAVGEAELLAGAGYDAGLVSLSAFESASVDELVAHCRAVAGVFPIMGFYLQPAAGGRLLPLEFWRRLAGIESLVAIKIAPFNRYQTFDVLRGVAESRRAGEIALYTGNDDAIVSDLLTTYQVNVDGEPVRLRIVGGLLGHWAFWTSRAVDLLRECHALAAGGGDVPAEMMTRAVQITDSNAAAFDAANGFAGCIAGIHEILMRQGLLAGRWTLNPDEDLSPGQCAEIDRVYAAYPHLSDDAFVAEHLDEWLA